IARVPKLKDIALHRLDGEVFMHGADARLGWLEDHVVVEVVRNGPAGGDGREPRSAPCAQSPSDGVMVHVGAAPPAGGTETLGQHVYDFVETLPRESVVRPRAPHELEELLLAVFPGDESGDDLLSEDVEGSFGH